MIKYHNRSHKDGRCEQSDIVHVYVGLTVDAKCLYAFLDYPLETDKSVGLPSVMQTDDM